MYQRTISLRGLNDNAKETSLKVAKKYQDILILEQRVAELHQTFLDSALLTEQQVELVYQSEYSVKGTADAVEEANVTVFEAILLGKKG